MWRSPRRPRRAATLPTGFTEALVASGLSNPTAMQFAPDGRLFVCEQGGRLRVIKNGALLSTPFLTVTVEFLRRARPARRRLRSGLRRQPVRLRLLHGHQPGHPQPHQPLHRQRRRRRGRQRGRPARPREPEQRHESQRRRPALRAGRQALCRRRRERRRRPTRRRSANLLGKMLRAQHRRHHPDRQPVLHDGDRQATARSGRSVCAIRSRSRSARPARRCSSTTSARALGRDQRRRRRRELRLARHRRRDDRSALRHRRATATRTRQRHLRHRRRRVLRARDRAVSVRLPERLFLRRLLRRLDPQARSGRRQHRHHLRHRHQLSGRPEGGRRRQPATTSRA